MSQLYRCGTCGFTAPVDQVGWALMDAHLQVEHGLSLHMDIEEELELFLDPARRYRAGGQVQGDLDE